MDRKKSALALFTEWFDNLSPHKSVGGPAGGTMAAALVVLERLKDDYNLNLDSTGLQADHESKEQVMQV